MNISRTEDYEKNGFESRDFTNNLGAVISIIALLLPSMPNNRVRFSESAFGLIPAGVFFLLGFIFTILSIIFTVRARKVAAIYRTQLEPEAIFLFE